MKKQHFDSPSKPLSRQEIRFRREAEALQKNLLKRKKQQQEREKLQAENDSAPHSDTSDASFRE